MVALAGYWLMFFKLQDSAFTMLPAVDTNLAGNDYDTFNVMIILCFVGLLIRVRALWCARSSWYMYAPGLTHGRFAGHGDCV